jgi:hypothetical protein
MLWTDAKTNDPSRDPTATVQRARAAASAAGVPADFVAFSDGLDQLLPSTV